MANEFVVQNGLLSLDSSAISGSLTVTGGVTGSFTGSLTGISTTASFALTTDGATLTISGSTPPAKTGSLWYDSTTGKTYVYYVSASVASWVLQSDPTFDPGPTLQDLQDVTDLGATTTNAIIITNTTTAANTGSGALIVSGGLGVKQNIYASNIIAVNTITATGFTASAGYFGTASHATSASFATTASAATSLTFTTFSNASYYFPQNLTVEGTLTAQEFYTEFISSSVIYESGSTKFGNSSDDVHQFTGSIRVLGGTTSSVFGTSSWANNSVSASFTPVGPGTSQSIALFNSSNTISSSNIVQSGNNIGIGTTSPQVTLQVSGSQIIDGGLTVYESGSSVWPITAGYSTRPTSTYVRVNASASTFRGFEMQTAGTRRWLLYTDNAAETGANVGSTFNIGAYNDAGSFIDAPITIERKSNGLIYFTRTLRAITGSNTSPTIAPTDGYGITFPTATNIGFVINSSEAMRIDSNRNVGIGTTSPTTLLHVEGITPTITVRGTSTNSPKINLAGTFTTWSLENQYVNGATNDMFRIHNSALSADAITINRLTNNVGIGTTNPSASLHVVRSATSGITTLIENTQGSPVNNPVLRISRLNNIGTVAPAPSASGLHIIEHSSNSALYVESHTNSPLFIVSGSGNIGINTTSSLAKLHVNDSASAASAQILVTNNGTRTGIRFGSSSLGAGVQSNIYHRTDINLVDWLLTTPAGATAQWQFGPIDNSAFAIKMTVPRDGNTTARIYSSTTHSFSIGANNITDIIWLTGSGNVGMGTTSPLARLHISASGTTSDLLVGTAATPKLVITDSGSVGIGIVPSNWWAGIRAIQFGQRGNLQSSNNTVALGFNSVYDSSSNFRYVASDYAVEYRLNSANGSHAWFIAPQGTAGNTISFTQAMTLDTSGSLGINTTAPYGRVHIRNGSSGVPSASVNANALVVESNQSNGVAVLLPAASTGYYTFGDPTDNRRGGMVYLLSSAAGGERMEFWVGGAGGSRMTILPTGNVGIGTQSPSAPLHVQGNISASSYTSSISNAVGFLGTSSWAQSSSVAISSSFSITASAANSITFTPTTASYALSGSWLRNKAGSIVNTAFTGNPRKAAVNFTGAFPNTNYAVVITGEDARTWTIEGKVAGGFTASANSNTALTGTTYWVATSYGET